MHLCLYETRVINKLLLLIKSAVSVRCGVLCMCYFFVVIYLASPSEDDTEVPDETFHELSTKVCHEVCYLFLSIHNGQMANALACDARSHRTRPSFGDISVIHFLNRYSIWHRGTQNGLCDIAAIC